jgi:hypothetical protein
MRYSLGDFISETSSVISEIEKEISERKSGIAGNGSLTQLEFIKGELVQLRQQAISNTLPPKDKRYTAFSRYVLDEWDVKDPLGNKLCGLADKYKRRL